MGIWISIGAVALLLPLFVVWVKKRLIKIASPELGILNLMGAAAQKMANDDRDAIRWAFFSVSEAVLEAPRCDVLLVYALVTPEGSLGGTPHTLRQIISESGAKVVIVANENDARNYFAALKQPGAGRANIVLTIDRRGWKFALFLNRLFEIMAKGIIMPIAWVRLAPQKPGNEHPDCPETIFLCEAGNVAFKRQGAGARSS